MTDDSKTPQQGGVLDDLARPNGLGKPSDDAPVLPSRQAVVIPKNFLRSKRK